MLMTTETKTTRQDYRIREIVFIEGEVEFSLTATENGENKQPVTGGHDEVAEENKGHLLGTAAKRKL